MKLSIILPGQKTPGWPKPGKSVKQLPTDCLEKILATKWKSDVHFVQYAVHDELGAYRYNKEVFGAPEFQGKYIEIIAIAFDVDSPAKKSKEAGAVDNWFEAEREKIHGLLQAYPGGMVWRTKGGWRGCWYCEYRIGSSVDATSWTRNYLAAIIRLEREFGIIADPACCDWNRLHRVPFGIRDSEDNFGWGEPEARETIGRLEEGKTLDISTFASEEDREEARRRNLAPWRDPSHPTKLKNKPAHADQPGGVVLSGPCVWEIALQRRGKIIQEVSPGIWHIECPNVAAHTTLGNVTSTLLYGPGPGEILGHIHCKHGHCQNADMQAAAGISTDEWNSIIKEVMGSPTTTVVEESRQEPTERDIINQIVSKLIPDKSGCNPAAIAQNATYLLTNHPYWKGRLAYDSFNHERYWVQVPDFLQNIHKFDKRVLEADVAAIQGWMWQHKPCLNISLEAARAALQNACAENTFDSLKNYVLQFDGSWDGTPRLESWLVDYMGAENTPINRAIGKRWLIAAVARAMDPGCVSDMMLVLEGSQGIGKGYMLNIMFSHDLVIVPRGVPFGSKDFDQKCTGAWCVHDDELASTRRVGLEIVKGWITEQTTRFRKAYDKDFIISPRRFVIAGSTNVYKYLTDEENRRFWPVRVTHLSESALIRDRAQLWAEAIAYYNVGTEYRISSRDELWSSLQTQHESRSVEDPLVEAVIGALQTEHLKPPFTIHMIMQQLNIQLEKNQAHGVACRIAEILRKLGFDKRKMMIQGIRSYYWSVLDGKSDTFAARWRPSLN